MLRALILQLSSQLDDHHSLLSRLHDSHRGAAPPVPALMDCLRQLIRAFEHVYVILDALDESPRHRHREILLQAVVDLRNWSEPGSISSLRAATSSIFAMTWAPPTTSWSQ